MYQVKDDFEEYAKAHFDELIALVKRLCEIPAPSLCEEKRMAFCKEWLSENGAQGVFTDEAKNVVYPLKDTGGNVVLFMAHTDTVFPDTEPMQVTEKDGKLYCPGVGDDTVNLAILMFAARYYLHSGKTPKEDLVFVCNAAEEGLGNLKGSRAVMQRYGDRVKEVVSFDLGTDRYTHKAVGSARYKIEIRTKGGHSWSDFGNKNAIAEAARLIRALSEQPMPQNDGNKTTFNVGTISGGTSVNTIAQGAEFTYEYRSDCAENMAKMQDNLQKILSAFSVEGVEVITEELGVRPSMGVCNDPDRQAKLFERTERIVEKYTGKKPVKKSASTDCNIPFSKGIPAVSFGLATMSGTHTREEYIVTTSALAGLKIALEFVGEYFV